MKKAFISFGRKTHAPKLTSRHLGLQNFRNVCYKSDGKDDDDDDSDVAVKEIRNLGKQHKEDIKSVREDYKKALTELEEKHKKELEALTKANDEDIQKAKAEAKAAADKVEELEKKMNSPEFAAARQVTKSTEQEIEEKLTAQKEQLGAKRLFGVELSTKAFGHKAVGNLSSAGNLTGSYFVTPDVKPGIVVRPYNEIHMRDLLPIGSTASNIIRHLRDNGGEGGPGMVAEGGTKPQMDRDLSIEDASVRKIATHLRVPEEMIEDIPYLVSFITNIGTEEVMAVEDAQILYGDGTGQNLSGLFTNATAFAAGASAGTFPAAGDPGSANEFDVLRAARKQMRKAKRTPSFALVSPTDYFAMTSAKDSTGNYILLGGGNGLVPTLDGVPVIEMNQVADGDYLLGDRRAAEIDFRKNVEVRFYEQDQDNAIKNMVTIVIEERLALPIYYTSGFIKGTFTAGKTALNAA